MKPPIGPLTFVEVFMPTPWGGRALARIAGKKLPPKKPIGESWELADHPRATSIVAEGPLKGRSLRALIEADPMGLVGRRSRGRFPLMVKLMDARDLLSIQVHPDDRTARALKLRDTGKTEAWHILHAGPNGQMVIGLKSRADVDKLRRLAESGAIADRVVSFRPKRGDTLLCEAGAIHALGPDLVVLEVQQNSDATFRLHDWGRVGLDGKPRDVHIAESIRAIGDGTARVRRMRPRTLRGMPFRAARLVACRQFVIDRWNVARAVERKKTGAFEILHVLKGRGKLICPNWPEVGLTRGRTCLIPAGCGAYGIAPRGTMEIIRAAEPDR